MAIEKPDGQYIIAGPPGVGKTTVERELVQKHLRRRAGVFVMDCNKQFSDILPWYATVAHYHWAQRRRTDGQCELSAAIGSPDSEELTGYVVDLCEKRKEPGCKWEVPYYALFYDEVTLIRKMSSSYVPENMEILMGNRRHIGVELAFLCQEMGQLHSRIQSLATHLVLFPTKSEERQRKIAGRFGIRREVLSAELSALDSRFEFLLICQEAFVSAREGI